MEQNSTTSKKGTAFSLAMAPLGALALSKDKTVYDLYLALIIVGALLGYLGVQAWLEAKKPGPPQ